MTKRKSDHKSRPYDIRNVGGQKAELLLYEQIGNSFWEEGITAKQFAHDLAKLGKVRNIAVRINSPGGSVFDGLAIYNTLKQHPATVDVYVDGMAFSIASVIAMAGDTVSIAKNALMMVHEPRGAVSGTPEEIAAFAELMAKSRDSIVSAYEDKTGKSRDELLAMVNAETYMNADEAVANGFADEVTDELAIAASWEVPEFLHVPDTVKAQISSFTSEGSDPMADTSAQSPVRAAATIADLKAMAGSTSDFVVAQLEACATVDEARAVLCAELVAKLDSAQKRCDELTAKLAEYQRTSTPAIPAKVSPQTSVKAEGVEPVVSTQAPSQPSADSPWGAEPVAWYRREVKRLTASGMSAADATRKIADEYPGIADAMLG